MRKLFLPVTLLAALLLAGCQPPIEPSDADVSQVRYIHSGGVIVDRFSFRTGETAECVTFPLSGKGSLQNSCFGATPTGKQFTRYEMKDGKILLVTSGGADFLIGRETLKIYKQGEDGTFELRAKSHNLDRPESNS